MEIEIANLTPEHWEAVGKIYLEGIATGQATLETTAPSWESWDAGHLPFARPVALLAGIVRGWAAVSPVSSRTVYAGVAETSVYVAQDCRGQGVGDALLEQLIAESEKNGIWMLQASLFPENEASSALHKRYGFRSVGRRERIGKLNGVWRDTLLLERRSQTVGID